MEYPNFIVSVHCMTYNQSKFIVEALDGFCMQETSFPFVCCIVDDASTDNEQDVIKEYVSKHFDMSKGSEAYEKETDYAFITYARHKTNRNCYFAVLLLKENLYQKRQGLKKHQYIAEWEKDVKYIAYCEGDDYWIHPKKLQMQVDWLEAHEDVTYSCCRFKIKTEKTGLYSEDWNSFYKKAVNKDVSEYYFDVNDAFTGNWVTLTVTQVVRKSAIDTAQYTKFKNRRDVHFIYLILKKGKGVCHSFVGCVYRMNEGGIHGGLSNSKQHYNNYIVYKELYDKTREKFALRIITKEYKQLVRMRGASFPKSLFELYCWVSVIIDKVKEVIFKNKE